MQMAKWQHVRAMREKEKKRRMRFPVLDCGHGFSGGKGGGWRTTVGKVRQPEQLFPGEISLSAGLVQARDIQRNSGQRRKGGVGGGRGRR